MSDGLLDRSSGLWRRLRGWEDAGWKTGIAGLEAGATGLEAALVSFGGAGYMFTPPAATLL